MPLRARADRAVAWRGAPSERWRGRAGRVRARSAWRSRSASSRRAAHALYLPLLARDRPGRALLGAPVFVAMGGVALLLLLQGRGTPIAAVPPRSTGSWCRPTLPAIPLLTRVRLRARRGRRVARGWCALPSAVRLDAGRPRAHGRRRVRAVHHLHRRLGRHHPGARRPASTRRCVKDEYPEGFSLGLVTASGSLGLLFPPSPAGDPLRRRRRRRRRRSSSWPASCPACCSIVVVAAYGIRVGVRPRRRASRSTLREVAARRLGGQVGAAACRSSSWRPVRQRLGRHRRGGGARRALRARRRAASSSATSTRCASCRGVLRARPATLVGAVADPARRRARAHQLPRRRADPRRARSRGCRRTSTRSATFLLALNVLLLVLGSVLEIYSAIIVLAPLVAPLGAGVRRRPGAPRRGLPRQPRARLPVPADGAQPVPLGVALRQAAARALPAGAAVPRSSSASASCSSPTCRR